MWKGLLCAVLALSCMAIASGQAAQPADTDSPAQVAADVELLLIVQRLGLTQDQIGELVPELEKAANAKAAFAVARTEATERTREHLDDMIEALAQGREPSAARADILARHLTDLESKRREMEQKLQQVRGQVVAAVLSPEAAALVETPEREQERLYRLRLWQGNTTALDFVMNSLAQARDLMPDEYANERLGIAVQTAAGLLDPSAPAFPGLRTRMLALFDELHDVPAQQFQRDEAQIREHVAQVLQITPQMRVPGPDEYISYSAFTDLLENPRTLKLFANEDVAPLPQDELQPRLNALDALQFAHRLQLDASQLRELAATAGTIQAVARGQKDAPEQAAAKSADLLRKARQLLLAGQELDAQTATQLQAFREKVDQERAAADQRLLDLLLSALDTLYPKQQALVEVPPELLAAPPAGEAPRRMVPVDPYLELKAKLVDLLTESRGVNPIDFAAARPDAIAEVVAGVVPPDTREYYRARWRLRRLMGRAALVSDEEFPLAVGQLADEFLQGHGILPAGAAGTLAPIPFAEFERVLGLPEAAVQWERLAGNLPVGWTGGG